MSDTNILLQGVQNHQNDLGYQMQILNNYQQLYDTVQKENNVIYSTYYQDLTFNSANSRQSGYVYQSTGILNTVSLYGFWIYIALAVVLSVIVFRKPMDIYYRVFLILAIITYPFYIYPLEELTYQITTYIWNMLISVAYNNGYQNTSLEYGIASGEKLSGPDVSVKPASMVSEASYQTGSGQHSGEGSGQDSGQDVPPLFIPPTRPPAPVPTLSTLQFDSSNSSDTTATIDPNDWGNLPNSSPGPPNQPGGTNTTTPAPK